MRRFAALYSALENTTSTRAKLSALVRYFRSVEPGDAAWTVFFLRGDKPRQSVPTRFMWQLAAETAGIPPWLFEECYLAVGDFAEAVAHILPDPGTPGDLPLRVWVEERLLPLRGLPDAELRRRLVRYWSELDDHGRLVWNKLITGTFRVGVSRQSVVRALAEVAEMDSQVIAQRLMGDWHPSPETYTALISREAPAAAIGQPYPFFLAHALEEAPETLGERNLWQAEWKWDGIRAQLIRRAGQTFLWSRSEDLITDRYPELGRSAGELPDGTVLDGEILAWQMERPLPFAALQKRIGRKVVTPRLLQECPVAFVAYDMLERGCVDVRSLALAARRALLEATLGNQTESPLRVSPLIPASSWEDLRALRSQARARNVEGVMLKRLDAPYGTGRVRGPWWKWKIDPYSIDAVLVYAQRGHGKRASLYTDYTFALWDKGELVPFAKAYSGLTDSEIRVVDSFIRNNTQEKFGPVRSVTPQLVCEIGFDGLQASSRHKAGIAVRFPRILRIRTDKAVDEADSLDTLKAMLNA